MIQVISLDTFIDLLNLGVIPPIIALIYQIWKSRRERKQHRQLRIVELLIREFRDHFEEHKGTTYNEILKDFLNIYFKVLEDPFLSKAEKNFRKSLSLIFTDLLSAENNINEFEKTIQPHLEKLM